MNAIKTLFTASLLAFSFTSIGQYLPPDFFNESYSDHYGYQHNVGQLLNTDGQTVPQVRFFTESTKPAVFVHDSKFSIVYYNITDTTDTAYRLDMTWTGSELNTGFQWKEVRDRTDYITHFLGHHSSPLPKAPIAERIVYEDIYPEIDFHLFSNKLGLKMCYVVKPGGNPNNILMKFEGQDSIATSGFMGADIYFNQQTIRLPQLFAYEVDSLDNMTLSNWLPTYNNTGNGTINITTSSYNQNNYLVLMIGVPEGKFKRSGGINGNMDWSTYYGNNLYNSAYQVLTDNLENSYVVGTGTQASFLSTVGVVQSNSFGIADATIVKFDSNGVRQWATYYGSPREEKFPRLTIGSNNHLYLAGTTEHALTGSTIHVPQTQPSGAYVDMSIKSEAFKSDVFIAEITQNADTLVWATYLGGAFDESLNDIEAHANGSIFLTSSANDSSPLVKKPGAYYDSTSTRSMLVQFNPNRALVWATRFNAQIRALDIDNEGYVYIAGAARDQLPIALPQSGAYIDSSLVNETQYEHGFFSRFHKQDHSLNWSTYFSGPNSSNLNDIIGNTYGEVPFSSIFVYGSTSDSLFPTFHGGGSSFIDSTFNGGSDAIIARFSNSDTLSMSTFFGGSGNETAHNIAVAKGTNVWSEGSLIATGYVHQGDIPCQTYNNWYSDCNLAGDQDFYLIAFNDQHEYVYGTHVGGNTSETYPNIAVGGDHVYLTGISKSVSPTYPLVDLGNAAWFDTLHVNSLLPSAVLTRFDFHQITYPTGIPKVNSKMGETFKLYPNPTDDHFTIEFTEGFSQNLQIINLQGQIVLSKRINSLDRISTQSLAKGVYIVKMNNSNKRLVIR